MKVLVVEKEGIVKAFDGVGGVSVSKFPFAVGELILLSHSMTVQETIIATEWDRALLIKEDVDKP